MGGSLHASSHWVLSQFRASCFVRGTKDEYEGQQSVIKTQQDQNSTADHAHLNLRVARRIFSPTTYEYTLAGRGEPHGQFAGWRVLFRASLRGQKRTSNLHSVYGVGRTTQPS